jgi:hypothetical protein
MTLMDRLRKLSLPALFAFAALFGVLVLQSSHHHQDPTSDHQHRSDCSVCSWQQTSSNATNTPSPVVGFLPFVFFILLLFSPFTYSTFCLSIPGRSPPQQLL